MDNGNPNSGNMNRETNKSEGRRNLHRRAARRPRSSAQLKTGSPEARARACTRCLQDSHPAQKHNRTYRAGVRGATQNPAAQITARMSGCPSPAAPASSSQARADGARLPQADIARRNTGKTDVARPGTGALPREVQFEAPVIDRKYCAAAQANGKDSRTGGRLGGPKSTPPRILRRRKPTWPGPQSRFRSAPQAPLRAAKSESVISAPDEFLPEKAHRHRRQARYNRKQRHRRRGD